MQLIEPMRGAAWGRNGFLPSGLESGFPMGVPSVPIFRGMQTGEFLTQELREQADLLQRGEFTGDIHNLLTAMMDNYRNFARTITSTTTAFPARENLEAPARLLVPLDTPVRNRTRRVPGAGTASAWKQETSLGGGYGVNTTVTSGTNSATQSLGSTAGMQAGDVLFFATANTSRIVSSVTDAVTVVLTATITTTTAEVVTRVGQPGTGSGAIRSFFAETGAPAAHNTVYANKSASYKLLGSYGDVTGFALAVGQTYQNQYAQEKTNTIRNLMLNEEHALVNGSSTIVAAPWGDGTNALGFDGYRNLITTANGVPVDQIQTAVGALTFAHIDSQVARIWNNGGSGMWILCNSQEALSISHLFDASGSTSRVVFSATGDLIAGRRVVGYTHPLTGEIIDVMVSRFMPPGTMIFGSDYLPDGSPASDISVLPQVMLPELAPDEQIQGYTAQELAPTTAAPQVYPWVATVYEVLRMKGATVFGKSTGLIAV